MDESELGNLLERFNARDFSNSLEDRLKSLEEQSKHPLYTDYASFCMERYGEHPMVITIRDLVFQLDHGFNQDEIEPAEGPLHERYGRVRGRETFVSFTEFLRQKSFDEDLDDLSRKNQIS